MDRTIGRLAISLLLSAFLMAGPSVRAGDMQEPSAKSSETRQAIGQLFQASDRVLFVGDQMTQQMFYDRAIATALLSLLPDRSLRFYNGGHDGATAASAVQWIDELMELAKPQVVIVCFGLSDALEPTQRDVEKGFGQGLSDLLDRVHGYAGVRRVILIGPMAVQPGINPRLDALGVNDTLTRLAKVAQEQARQHRTIWIDLTPVSLEIMQAASQIDGDPLSFINGQPTEIGHALMAGMVLGGLGATPQDMAKIGWAPLPSRAMARIRTALSVTTPVPSFEQAQRCRDLYTMLLEHEQLFFRAWRIAGKMPSAGSRETALAMADQAWSRIDKHVRQVFGESAGKSSP